MTHVFMTMGTAVSLNGDPGLFAEVEAVFTRLDHRFSMFRADSEASRIASGELRMPHASRQFQETYALAHDWRKQTYGAFRPHRPDGVIDLAGIVKALAIAEAGAVLSRSEGTWLINAGGDVLTGEDTVVGIVDPFDRTRLLSEFQTTAGSPAVATSGTSERGEHIWRVGTTDEFCQVSVAAGDIITADVLATAIMSGGRALLDDVTERFDIQVLAVSRDGEYLATSAFRGKR